jgi:ketosteroid isomerase-like protein
MKKLFMILPLVLVLYFVAGCQQGEEAAEEPAVDIAAETEAVRSTNIAWAKTGEAKDVEGMTSFFTEDALILWPYDFGGRTYWSDYWTERFSDPSWEVAWQPENVVVADSGELAYSFGKVQNTRVENGETKTSKGTYLAVWKKQADGSWKVAVMK